MTKATRPKAMPRSSSAALTPGPARADRAGRVRPPSRAGDHLTGVPDALVRHAGEGGHRARRARGTSARPASPRRRPAERGQDAAEQVPRRPAPAPSGSTAGRKRCTRPSKFVKVPSRSTHAAAGSTQWARALVALALVPAKITVSTRPSAADTSRGRPARGQQVVVEDPQAAHAGPPARPRGPPRASPPRPISSAPRVLGLRSARSRKSSLVGRARAGGTANATWRIPRRSSERRSAIRSSLAICGDASTAISLGRVAAQRVGHGRHRVVPVASARRRARAESASSAGWARRRSRSRSGLRRRSTTC